MVKFIVITGGVISGIGKGITASSIGLILKLRSINVTAIKIDPYLNVDAGTMSPAEHGECYVLEDGGEVDLDLGNYERFLNINLTRDHSITTGKVYNSVIRKERQGNYLGKTVQIVPHITNEIQEMIMKAATIPIDNRVPDVCIIEIGGTVGDMETCPFIEAIRQLSFKYKDDFLFVHVAKIIMSGLELKTKPIQSSVTQLRSLGIQPDILVIRNSNMLPDSIKEKLEVHCNIKKENIISNIDVPNIYYVPKIFEEQNIFSQINDNLKLNPNIINKPNFEYYNNVINYFDLESGYKSYNLIIAGKYTNSQDAYLFLIRAIEHAVFNFKIKINIVWLDTELIENIDTVLNNKLNNKLSTCAGIIIPGGFGSRGILGKMKVAEWARKNNIPLLGICLGMQIMVTEYAKNVCGFDATSSEWTDLSGKDFVVDILPEQTGLLGGTMRLGNWETVLKKDSQVYNLYGGDIITERHRHRYEVNNKYVKYLEDAGLKFTGTNNKGTLMEMVEMPNHPFYIGCQFHPEFKSKYDKPHPLFIGLIKSMINL